MKRFIITIIIFLCLAVFPAFGERPLRILVYPFQNQGKSEHAWIAAGMTDSVIADLGRITSVSVISDEDRKKAMKEISFGLSDLADDKTAARIGRLVGADTIFTGGYTVAGGKIRIIARLVNVESGVLEKSVKLDGTLDGIFDVQDKIVFGLMAESGAVRIANVAAPVLTNDEKTKIETKARPVLNAYESYAKGLTVNDTDPAGAVRLYQEALAIDPEYVSALIMAGHNLASLQSRIDEGLAYLEKAAAVLSRRNESNTVPYAIVLNKIGVAYMSKGKMETALQYYFKAKDIYDGLGRGDSFDSAVLLMNIGNLYYRRGQLDRALEYYAHAREIWEKLGLRNSFVYGNVMNNSGLAYADRGDHARALECYAQARDIYERLGMQDTTANANVHMNMGLVAYAKGEYESALELYRKSREIRDKIGLQETVDYSNLMMNFGAVYLSKKDYSRAVEYYSKSREILESLGLHKTVNYANLLYNLASLNESQGRRTEAGKLYRQAYEVYGKAGYTGTWKDEARKNAERLGQ